MLVPATADAARSKGKPRAFKTCGDLVRYARAHAKDIVQPWGVPGLGETYAPPPPSATVPGTGGGGGGAGLGGAVFNEAGTVIITNSTFTGNTAGAGSGGRGRFGAKNGTAGKGLGGGVFNHNGTITVTNSTFSANTAAQGGRGIFNLGDSVFETTQSKQASPLPWIQ